MANVCETTFGGEVYMFETPVPANIMSRSVVIATQLPPAHALGHTWGHNDGQHRASKQPIRGIMGVIAVLAADSDHGCECIHEARTVTILDVMVKCLVQHFKIPCLNVIIILTIFSGHLIPAVWTLVLTSIRARFQML